MSALLLKNVAALAATGLVGLVVGSHVRVERTYHFSDVRQNDIDRFEKDPEIVRSSVWKGDPGWWSGTVTTHKPLLGDAYPYPISPSSVSSIVKKMVWVRG